MPVYVAYGAFMQEPTQNNNHAELRDTRIYWYMR